VVIGMAKLEIGPSASGTTVQVVAGTQLQLTLPETRTAGYSWKVISVESPVFSVADAGFTRADSVGGTGVHRWTVRALQKGRAKLELAYGRSWETSGAKKFAVVVVVE
jgi:predicted secreted protein